MSDTFTEHPRCASKCQMATKHNKPCRDFCEYMPQKTMSMCAERIRKLKSKVCGSCVVDKKLQSCKGGR